MLGIAILLATTAPAQAATKLESAIQSCRLIGDASGRLACFDALDVPGSKAADITQGATAPSTTCAAPVVNPVIAKPQKAPAAGPKDGTFGSETVQVPRNEQVDKLTATSLDTFDGIRKGQQIRLDNGQVWLCVDDRIYDYEATRPGVSIERNFAGNYWMKLSDSSFRIRVRRIK